MAFTPEFLAECRERARESRAKQGLPLALSPEVAAKVARLVAGAKTDQAAS